MKLNKTIKHNILAKYQYLYIPLILIIILLLIYLLVRFSISKNGFTSDTDNTIYEKADKIVYCCWTGNNPMSDDRKGCYESILKNIGVKVVLITPENMNEYIKPEYPLHKSYEYLSYTHKADYLRTYMMHIYGGGYTDIKQTAYSWEPYFDVLNNYKEKWALGTTELGAATVACYSNCDWVSDNWYKVIGNCAYIFKKQTPLTTAWFNEMNKLLDDKYEELRNNPAQVPDDSNGKEIKNKDGNITNSKYPLNWAEMLGAIFHPLCYKYNSKIIHALPPINTTNYR